MKTTNLVKYTITSVALQKIKRYKLLFRPITVHFEICGFFFFLGGGGGGGAEFLTKCQDYDYGTSHETTFLSCGLKGGAPTNKRRDTMAYIHHLFRV